MEMNGIILALIKHSNAMAKVKGSTDSYILSKTCWGGGGVNICKGFIHFSGLLHHFILAKLATSSIRVNRNANASM